MKKLLLLIECVLVINAFIVPFVIIFGSNYKYLSPEIFILTYEFNFISMWYFMGASFFLKYQSDKRIIGRLGSLPTPEVFAMDPVIDEMMKSKVWLAALAAKFIYAFYSIICMLVILWRALI